MPRRTVQIILLLIGVAGSLGLVAGMDQNPDRTLRLLFASLIGFFGFWLCLKACELDGRRVDIHEISDDGAPIVILTKNGKEVLRARADDFRSSRVRHYLVRGAKGGTQHRRDFWISTTGGSFCLIEAASADECDRLSARLAEATGAECAVDDLRWREVQ